MLRHSAWILTFSFIPQAIIRGCCPAQGVGYHKVSSDMRKADGDLTWLKGFAIPNRKIAKKRFTFAWGHNAFLCCEFAPKQLFPIESLIVYLFSRDWDALKIGQRKWETAQFFSSSEYSSFQYPPQTEATVECTLLLGQFSPSPIASGWRRVVGRMVAYA